MLYTVNVYDTSLVTARPDQLRIFISSSLLCLREKRVHVVCHAYMGFSVFSF